MCVAVALAVVVFVAVALALLALVVAAEVTAAELDPEHVPNPDWQPELQ